VVTLPCNQTIIVVGSVDPYRCMDRVEAAYARQQARQGKANADLTSKEIECFCPPDAAGETLLKLAIGRLSLSARAYHRVLKVARTIADLAGSEGIGSAHIAEAIQYRRFAQL